MIDLITQILKIDPEERLSLADIMKHPWCQGPTKQLDLKRDKVVVTCHDHSSCAYPLVPNYRQFGGLSSMSWIPLQFIVTNQHYVRILL